MYGRPRGRKASSASTRTCSRRPGRPRNEALKALGNGVVPPQAVAALRLMVGRTLLQLELERLDTLQQAAWVPALKGNAEAYRITEGAER